MFPDGATLVIGDAEGALIHPPECHWPEVYVPESVADFFEADVLTRERVRHADPVAVPADPAVAADTPHFEMTGVLHRGESRRERAR